MNGGKPRRRGQETRLSLGEHSPAPVLDPQCIPWGKNFCRATASSQIQPVLGGKHSVLNAQVLRAKHAGGPGGLLGFDGLLVVVAVRAVVMVVAVLSDC